MNVNRTTLPNTNYKPNTTLTATQLHAKCTAQTTNNGLDWKIGLPI